MYYLFEIYFNESPDFIKINTNGKKIMYYINYFFTYICFA